MSAGYIGEAVGSGMKGIGEEDNSVYEKIDGANVSANLSVAGMSYRRDQVACPATCALFNVHDVLASVLMRGEHVSPRML